MIILSCTNLPRFNFKDCSKNDNGDGTSFFLFLKKEVQEDDTQYKKTTLLKRKKTTTKLQN